MTGKNLETCCNHPKLERSAACANCHRPFCAACLVTLRGQHWCSRCSDALLVHLQTGEAGTVHRLRLLRIRSLVWAIGALGLMVVLLAVNWSIPGLAAALLMLLLFGTTLLTQLLLWAIDFQRRKRR